HLPGDFGVPLTRPRGDGAGARCQERLDPRVGRVRRARRVGLKRARRLAAGGCQRVGSEDVDAELGDLLVVLAPVELRDRSVRPWMLAGAEPRGTPPPV